MLYHLNVQLKHLNTGNFLKYPGLFPDRKSTQVISPCRLLLFACFSSCCHLYTKQHAKVGKEAETKSFCVASPVEGFTVAETGTIRSHEISEL